MLNDGLYHISLMGGQARAILIESTNLVQRAKDIHHLSRTATAALGRTLTMAAIMGSMLKNDSDSITAQIKGGGPIGTILAVAHGDCSVKGYVGNPDVELPRVGKKLPVGPAVGKDGRLTVIKDLHLKEPYVGQVNLVSGEIAGGFRNVLHRFGADAVTGVAGRAGFGREGRICGRTADSDVARRERSGDCVHRKQRGNVHGYFRNDAGISFEGRRATASSASGAGGAPGAHAAVSLRLQPASGSNECWLRSAGTNSPT